MPNTRLALPVLCLCAALAALVAGCGGGGGSSGAEPATVAPPETALFVEAVLRPTGSLKSNVETLAREVAGIEDLGGTIVERLEGSLGGGAVSYEKDVEPWLGEKAGMAFTEYDGSSFSGYVIALQSTDTGATEAFIEKLATQGGGHEITDGSFEGVDFKVNRSDGSALGLVGEMLVFAQSESSFKAAVEASEGESLAAQGNYSSVSSHAASGSLADIYVDIGGLVRQSGGEVDPQAESLLKDLGIELESASAMLSLVPGSDRVEIDLASDLGGEPPAEAPSEELLEAMPGTALAAVSASEFGKRLQEGFDALDAGGIPGEVPPHKLKSTLKQAGVDLDAIAGPLEDGAIFVVGSSRSSLGGALVLTTAKPAQAANTVANIGLLLRANHTPGVTVIHGPAAGFSIRSPEIGPKPVVVAAKGDRIAIGYGLPATIAGLGGGEGTLAQSPAFEAAKQALGDTPIAGFVDGAAALKLADRLVPTSDAGYRSARPYLAKIGYIGLGRGTEGSLATAKLIVGLGSG